MLILNQNKDSVLNLEELKYLSIVFGQTDYYTGYKIIANFSFNEDKEYFILGIYETEKRAKEVLKEIVHIYNRIYIDNIYNSYTYEMPEE